MAKLWSVESGEELQVFRGHDGNVDISFSPQGSVVATVGDESDEIKLWSLKSGAELLTIKSNSDIYSISFSPSGKLLAGGSFDSAVRLWHTPRDL